MEHDVRNFGLGVSQQVQAQASEAICFVGRQYDPNQDYLDRVALEAMKGFLVSDHYDYRGLLEELAGDSYALARAMLKARSQVD